MALVGTTSSKADTPEVKVEGQEEIDSPSDIIAP